VSSGSATMSVVLATDGSFAGDGLAAQLSEIENIDVVGRTGDYLDLSGLVAECRPNAVVISLRTSTVDSLPTVVIARQLRRAFDQMGVVIIGGHDETCELEAIRDGSSRMAFLLDERLLDFATVVSALREVCAGQSVLDPSIVDRLVGHYEGAPVTDLTSREPEVLEHMARGLSNRAIASTLNISVKAIEKDITAIFRKLDLVDRTLVDRRVTAALTFLRTLTDPFGPEAGPDRRPPAGAEPGVDSERPRRTHFTVFDEGYDQLR